MKPIRIIADAHIPFLTGKLEPFAEISYLPGIDITPEKITNADALLIRTRTKINEALLKNTSVSMVASATIGLDHVDLNFCQHAGITVHNVPGCNAGSVAQYVIAGILHYAVQQRISLKDYTLGIIGVGNVGKKVADFAKAIGLNLLLNDPPRAAIEGSANFVDLDYLLQHSDIISLHVPLNVSGKFATYNLVNESFAGLMKRNALFINTSRGEVVKEEVLFDLLKSVKISGAILDVWKNEPNLNTELANLALIATPHIAGYSINGKAAATQGIIEHTANFFGFNKQFIEPIKLPSPPHEFITISEEERTFEQALYAYVSHSYNITADSLALKNDFSNFEKLRNNYPVRHEFYNFSIENEIRNAEIRNSLLQLGFQFK
ncbi:MAG TPA: hypothetical protein DCQ31_00440 [Bacteroidales bacterium]|nr:hypothetical protein [Bacteroidales bacterium]